MTRKAAVLLVLVHLAGCSLYNEVQVSHLTIHPSHIERGSDIHSMLRKADYLRAIAHTPALESRERRVASDIAAAGTAHLIAGRYDEARRLLRAAIDLDPFRTKYAEIAWDLSQVEYLQNNMASSLDWAETAQKHGLQIRPWHLEYLRALVDVPIYRFSGTSSARVPLRFGKPDVPRIDALVNGQPIEAIIDSGAVLSIMSERLAASLPVERISGSPGTFYGLLGEPIPVRFGLLGSFRVGGMTIENIPVAIMPDDKMLFLLSRRDGTQFRMDFLLGSHLLKEMKLVLDFDHRQIEFARLSAADRKPDEDQNMFMSGFRPHVRSVVNRKGWHLFVLDTGSEITFLNQSRIASLPVSTYGAAGHTATLQGLGGAMKRGAKIPDVEVGIDEWGGKFKTLPTYASEDERVAVGIIGQNFLKNFNVVIDFGRMRIDLERR
jgi:hypothetical protein